MNRSELETIFSKERLHNFFLYFPGNERKSIFLYVANKQISESFYSSLAVLEISLRNAIHRELSRRFKKPNWYETWQFDSTLRPLWKDIDRATGNIIVRGRKPTPGRIVAELTFGFWTSLFNQRYEKVLWKQLRFAFPHLAKFQRQRKTISAPLNLVRKEVRNRIYHYEPIIWNLEELQNYHRTIYLLLDWMDPKISNWLTDFDRFPNVLVETQNQLKIL